MIKTMNDDDYESITLRRRAIQGRGEDTEKTEGRRTRKGGLKKTEKAIQDEDKKAAREEPGDGSMIRGDLLGDDK